jgi:uncharacterized protein YbaA (DUF1428 family)
MAYVDGFVLPVPKKNLAAYRKMENKAGKVWMKHGALSYNATVADDVKPGKVTSFPQSVKLKDGETVIFAWITYKSRKHRDQVNAKVMKRTPTWPILTPRRCPLMASACSGAASSNF